MEGREVSGSALALGHVPRPRLIEVLLPAPLAIVEAAGGYGKSVLASDLRSALAIASAEAVLERETAEPEQVIGALRRGLRRAGLSDAAAALAGTSAGELSEALA